MNAKERQYLQEVAKAPHGLNNHMKGWEENAIIRQVLTDLGMVEVRADKAAHAFDVDATYVFVTPKGRGALAGRAPDRLAQAERDGQHALRELAGILSRAKLHEGDIGSAGDLLLAAGFEENTEEDTALLNRADKGR